ncbi:MAG: hypothetical protein ACKOU6_07840, partial [Planctomycetota bacterium]
MSVDQACRRSIRDDRACDELHGRILLANGRELLYDGLPVRRVFFRHDGLEVRRTTGVEYSEVRWTSSPSSLFSAR